MSTDTMSITIDPRGNLIVKAVQNAVKDLDNGRQVIKEPAKVCELKVHRGIFTNSSRSFKGFLSGKNSRANVVEIYHTVSAVEIWMKALHRLLRPNDMLDLPIKEVKDIINMGRKFELRIEVLQPWFSSWYKAEKEKVEKKALESQTEHDAENIDNKLLKTVYDIEWLSGIAVLSYIFDHSEGFAFASKHLVYDSKGHLELRGPIPHRISYQINAARCTLANTIDRTMFYPVYHSQGLKCECKEPATFAYIGALQKARVFNGKSPFDMADHLTCSGRGLFDMLGQHFRNPESRSVHEQVMNLGHFEYNPPANACDKCKEVVRESDLAKLRRYILNEFRGLCLDCITSSADRETSPKYLGQKSRVGYGNECRFKAHGKTTWWFSFMGRPNERDAYMEDYYARQAGEKDAAGNSSEETKTPYEAAYGW